MLKCSPSRHSPHNVPVQFTQFYTVNEGSDPCNHQWATLIRWVLP